MIALQRWNKRRASRTNSNKCGGGGGRGLEQEMARERNGEGDCEHSGSCHCGSVYFLVGTHCSVLSLVSFLLLVLHF